MSNKTLECTNDGYKRAHQNQKHNTKEADAHVKPPRAATTSVTPSARKWFTDLMQKKIMQNRTLIPPVHNTARPQTQKQPSPHNHDLYPESIWAKGSSNSGNLSNMFTSSHLHILTSSHLHIRTSSHLLIFTSSHLHIFTSSHPLLPSCSLARLLSYPLLFPHLPGEGC